MRKRGIALLLMVAACVGPSEQRHGRLPPPRLPAEPDLTGVPEESESALAWALREAVTNVVRHSGAARCTIELLRRQTLDGPVLELSVEDNGSGGSDAGPGNGLTGLPERLENAGGALEAGRVRRGFRLVARVPVDTSVDVGSPA